MNNDMSKFRMNVDGISSRTFQNIDIRANDSIYIFVEVTIDPDDPLSLSPFIITDAIVVEGGSISQKIILEAWGQNANYVPNRFNSATLIRLTCNNQDLVWDDPKPYVIYGILFIDSCHIVMPPGTQVYVHGGIADFNGVIANDGALFLQEHGKLSVLGKKENPVVFQGDRLEGQFENIAGQWTGIVLLANSKDHVIKNAIIKNSVIGIRADSAATLTIDKTQIFNTSNAGVIGIHADISISNSLIHNNGTNSLFFGYGGNYNINYTTIANYGNQDPAIIMDNFLCLDSDCSNTAINPLHVTFTNTIISGSNGDEILFIDILEGADPASFEMNYKNCVVKIDELTGDEIFNAVCSDCMVLSQGDSLYVDIDNYDFYLNQNAIAIEKAMPLESIVDDLDNNLRDLLAPDIGCYEFQ